MGEQKYDDFSPKENEEGEIKFFDSNSAIWWDENSHFKGLHTLNNQRVPLTIKLLKEVNLIKEENINKGCLLKGIKILDAGCGGGIFAEALAKLGGDVTGIDLGEDLIKVAKDHAALDPSLNIKYKITSIEDHSEKYDNFYDCVLVSEVIEHVTEKESFLKSCVKCLKPGGVLLITTFHKTWIAQIVGIWLAEYIFGLIPKGTHHYSLFASIEEVTSILEKYQCKVRKERSWWMNPFNLEWFHPHSIFPEITYVLSAFK